MNGTVKNVVAARNFGFIRCDGKEYFFHREDFMGEWDDLVNSVNARQKVQVEFDEGSSPKGPRAANVQRLYN